MGRALTSMRTLSLLFDEGVGVRVILRDEQTATIKALISSLPFSSKALTWGDEVYFEAPFHVVLEKDAREAMAVGGVAYWPDGNAIAVFFGKTPASVDDEPRAYSPCNIVGKVSVGLGSLRKVRSGFRVQASLG
jgi:hypothetical protein